MATFSPTPFIEGQGPLQTTTLASGSELIRPGTNTIFVGLTLTGDLTLTLPLARLYSPGRSIRVKDVIGAASSVARILLAPANGNALNGGTAAVAAIFGVGDAEVFSDGVSGWAVSPAVTIGTTTGTIADGAVANNSELTRQRNIWRRQGVVLMPGPGADSAGAQEASVIYEPGPQVIANTGTSVFKMWYTGGFSYPGIGLCYAESYDAKTWTKYAVSGTTAFVLSNYVHGCVIKYSGTYYFMGVLLPAGTQADIYSSTNGITWTLVKSSAVTTGGTGWKQQFLGNVFLMPPETVGGAWQLIYEALDAAAHWSCGYASSPTINGTYTDYSSNPVLAQAGGTLGGPWIQKVNGVYWAWSHVALTGHLPCDIYRFSSPDLKAWTRSPLNRPVLARASADEGAGSSQGQVADPWLVEANGRTYMFYEGTSQGDRVQGGFRMKLAIADATVAQLSGMQDEGADSAEAMRNGNAGNPAWFNATFANQGANTTVADGVHATLVWDAAIGGNGNSPTENSFGSNGAFYAPVSGLYRFTASVQLNATYTTGARFILQLLKNGTEPTGGRLYDYPLPAVTTPKLGGDALVYCQAGDAITIVAWPIGTAISIAQSGVTTCFLGNQLS